MIIIVCSSSSSSNNNVAIDYSTARRAGLSPPRSPEDSLELLSVLVSCVLSLHLLRAIVHALACMLLCCLLSFAALSEDSARSGNETSKCACREHQNST